MNYLKPAYLDDYLTVETKVESITKASLKFNQKIYKKVDNHRIEIINSKCKIVAIDNDAKVKPIPIKISKKITEAQ